jgi:hypothetical protein
MVTSYCRCSYKAYFGAFEKLSAYSRTCADYQGIGIGDIGVGYLCTSLIDYLKVRL